MDISRRTFLKSGLATIGLTLTSSDLWALASQNALTGPSRSKRRILVVIQLAGGNDGLNTVVPLDRDQYQKARPTIAIKEPEPIDQNVGLPASMSKLLDLYKSGKVAIIQNVGYPEPTRSHFRSIEIWQTGDPFKVKGTGWLGRYLDHVSPAVSAHDSEVRFPAINADAILPKTLSAEKVVVPSIANLPDFKFKGDSRHESDRLRQIEAFNDMYSLFDSRGNKYVQQLRMVGLDTTRASDQLAQMARSYKSSSEYPKEPFGQKMKFIAQLITGGVDCQIYHATLSGFDTHTNQPRSHENLLRQLTNAIAAFQSDLEQHGMDNQVVVMTFSEFGRRVAENGSRGTDHGMAAPLFLVGKPVKGRLIGDAPNLSKLKDGDLEFRIDFRNVYASVLEKWLAADSKPVLGDRFDTLDLFQS